MLTGHLRDHVPRLTLLLPRIPGPVPAEFIIDTGSEGDGTLPLSMLQRMNAEPLFLSLRSLADGSVCECRAPRFPSAAAH